jgi:hypothetical protein
MTVVFQSKQPLSPKVPGVNALAAPSVDPDDPSLSMPMARYNAMLAVVRNTLYMCPISSQRISRFCDSQVIADTAVSMNVDLENIPWMIFIRCNWIKWIVTCV